MEHIAQDTLLFFSKQPAALPLYSAFERTLLQRYPGVSIRVQKTQITFSDRHVFACISLQRVKRKAELPNPYLVVTLGLPFPLESPRVAAKTEPWPGRWTTHIVICSPVELDDELFSWVHLAYDFAKKK